MIQPNFPPNVVPPPAPQYPQVIGVIEGWETGLLDCLDDPTNAIITAFFPCMTFGQLAEIMNEGHTSCATSALLYGLVAFLIGAPCLFSCVYRAKLRSKFALIESPVPDWVIHLLFEHCALCQEYRKLKHRGCDPTIGWRGNASRNQIMMMQNQQATMMPLGSQRMMG
ncbi:hypothetical protein SLEP1_g33239 [Rubroshorea leprosula]|uniref:PLAC8 family protein n=1 Tax=Rubroshorea leprosula TaxID=152421 RepID=A0AAV5KG03_9ROSI|nr:hypothetical protein SLEP1_g33239 [Rubroshorea leprosula]